MGQGEARTLLAIRSHSFRKVSRTCKVHPRGPEHGHALRSHGHFRRISRRPRNGKRLFPRPNCLSRRFTRVFPSLKVVYPLHVSDNARPQHSESCLCFTKFLEVPTSRVHWYHAFIRVPKKTINWRRRVLVKWPSSGVLSHQSNNFTYFPELRTLFVRFLESSAIQRRFVQTFT